MKRKKWSVWVDGYYMGGLKAVTVEDAWKKAQVRYNGGSSAGLVVEKKDLFTPAYRPPGEEKRREEGTE